MKQPNREVSDQPGFYLGWRTQETNLTCVYRLAGYGISMLKRLADAFPSSISPLTYQYRMNGEICQLSSDAVYDGRLKCASEDVALKLLELHDFPKSLPHLVSTTSIPWLTEVIDPARGVVFMDTDKLKSGTVTYKREVATRSGTGSMAEQIDALESRMGKRYDGKIVNQTEATLVRYIIKALMAVGLQAGDIGVVCPFRAQVSRKELSTRSKQTSLRITHIAIPLWQFSYSAKNSGR